MSSPRIFVAIPLMDESENIPVLLEDIGNQSLSPVSICCCVNQPEAWWDSPGNASICEDNQRSLQLLAARSDLPITLIDRSSRGKGWTGKKHGVGWARKLAMDQCAAMAEPGDLIVSLDGDTRFPRDYFLSVSESLQAKPSALAIAVPYWHALGTDEAANRAILRYEIYMRYYALNLWRTNSPYSFTALGSALVVRNTAYRAIRGMTPNKSGEDFYFLQKLRKMGPLLFWNNTKVFPAARFSSRVFFGTGPAMIKGNQGDWSSYPLYHHRHFDDVASIMASFPALFYEEIETPLDGFLASAFNEVDIWKPLRENHPDQARFIRACHEKIDGLRILQYVKSKNLYGNLRDERHLIAFLLACYPNDEIPACLKKEDFSFQHAGIAELDAIRSFLAHREEIYQLNHFQSFSVC